MNDDVVLDDAFEIKDENFIDRHSDDDDNGDNDDELESTAGSEVVGDTTSSERIETTLEQRAELFASPDREKRERKKRKFEELKAQIATKKPQSKSESVTFSKTAMINVLKANAPTESGNSLTLKVANFLDIEEFKSEGSSSSKESSIPSKYVQAMEAGFSSLKKALKIENIDDIGSPRVLIVCSSASKATEIIKEVSLTLKCKIAKLYAKHFKVSCSPCQRKSNCTDFIIYI